MKKHVDKLLPMIMSSLQDQSSSHKREVALRTMGQLLQSTGCVLEPYLQYPNLLKLLLSEVKGEQTSGIRYEVIKLLGILGAVDPYQHKVPFLWWEKGTRIHPPADDGIGSNS